MPNVYLKRMICVAMITLLLLSTFTVQAATTGTLNCTISEFTFDSNGELYLNISGEAKGAVSVFVYDSSMDPTEFSMANLPVVFDQFDLGGRLTAFDYDLSLPSDLLTGSYDIKVVAKDGSYKFVEDYFYFNEVSAEIAKNAVNAAILISSSEVIDALTENAEALLIEQADLDTYGVFASDLLFSRKDSDGEHIQYATAAELMKVFTEAKAIYNVENRSADKTMEVAIAENASALGLDLTADYQTNLTASAKTELYSLLGTDEGWKIRPYANMYKELTALASVKKAENWSVLKSVVTSLYADIINIDTTEYTSSLDDIFAEMIMYPCNSFADIKYNFDLSVGAVLGNNSNPGPVTPPPAERYPSGNTSSGNTVIGNAISSALDDKTDKEVSKFKDLPDDHWAVKEINYLVEKNIFTGYPDGTFGGSKPITRAEFATILAKAFSLHGSSATPFEDVNVQDWYSAYVVACYSNGIINGTSETTFSPNATITREDAAVMVSRLLSGKMTSQGEVLSFTDSSEISAYAAEAVKALYNAKLLNGIGDNQFAPKENINRQSAAKLIYDAMMFKK